MMAMGSRAHTIHNTQIQKRGKRMAKIILQHGIDDKKEQYNLLNVKEGKLSDHKGERLEVAGFAFIERDNRTTGEVTEVFFVKTKDGELLGTSSNAFLDGVRTFLSVFGPEELTTLEVGTAVSKQNREYLVFKA